MSLWFRSAPIALAPSLVAADEDRHLQNVERALLKLLDDDIVEADRMLSEHDSAYHCLGRGISSFIAATLGAEKDLLKSAGATLLIAQNKAWENMKIAQKDPKSFRSAIYPPGTEYLLCACAAQLTGAITAVMSGSIAEAIKGFYKLRKANLTLGSIMAMESNYLKRRAAGETNLLASHIDLTAGFKATVALETPLATSGSSSSIASESDMCEKGLVDDPVKPLTSSDVNQMNHSAAVNAVGDSDHSQLTMQIPRTKPDIDPEIPLEDLTQHTDIFIHSGTRMCYGLLLVVFSMIENPVFSKILYIVGFQGERERGSQLLWQATRFSNFTGAMAGIFLLSYYNALVRFCDILPTDAGADDNLSGYPKTRCDALFAKMRTQLSGSKLWKLEEARAFSFDRNLAAAVEILVKNTDSSLKQVAMINTFELAFTTMYVHDYAHCAESWLKCAELGSWSPALYSYMTGGANLELYRNLRSTDKTAAEVYKKKATEYIKAAPSLAGKQKVMSKELPFDRYVVRKVQKWEERALSWEVDLVDAIGISPLAEMMHHWNGIQKMGPLELEQTLKILQWERASHPEKLKNDLDEQAIQSLVRARVLRNLGKFDEARGILQNEILNHDRREFKGHLKDDWTCPGAHYEMACIAWKEKDLEGVDHKAKVLDCGRWVDKTQRWGEEYNLDTTMSFKLTTAQITLKRHKSIIGI